MGNSMAKGETTDYIEDYVCVNDDSTSHSSSTVACKIVKGSHVLKVHGYSILKQLRKKGVESQVFEVGGHSWRLELCLNGDSDDDEDSDSSDCDEDVGLFLHLLDKREAEGEPVFARPSFRVLSQDGTPAPETCIGWCRFPDGITVTWGDDLISRDELEKSEYLKDDSFAVRCDVEVAVLTQGHDD